MNPQEFVDKWSQADISERGGYQMHFNDLCDLFSAPKPGDLGANQNRYCFEKRAARVAQKAKGWADVWRKDCFAWEYKDAHKDLEAAYDQLLRYHDDLGSVPVLVVSDMHTIIVRIKRTNRALIKREISLHSLAEFPSPNFEFLKKAFLDPQNLESGENIELITQGIAGRLGEVADSLKKRYSGENERIARFLDRVVFGFFAEDAGLLPTGIIEGILDKGQYDSPRVSRQIFALFSAMKQGGDFGTDEIRHFNGSLFDDLGEVIELSISECRILLEASRKNWAEIDPSIFGTLFERSLDDDKRSQLGAHYTSRSDIETLVEPVVLKPLRDEWKTVREELESLIEKSGTGNDSQARILFEKWLRRLGEIRVLDPACGSGNFLYVALERLLDLEKQARVWGEDIWGNKIEGRIRPEHFLGLELNVYAHDLARIVVWIGYLQWQRTNGFDFPADPILRHSENIQHCDALLNVDNGIESATEREWPRAEFIVGNPPFLGGALLWSELGRDMQSAIWRIYGGRVGGSADLCCYWFEKARAQIANGSTKRAGLVATQGIRGGANREVLKRIKASGDIFFAISDRDWTLDGANVHISLVGFDAGKQQPKELDGLPVEVIHSNLTARVDVTQALPLDENSGICLRGTQKSGEFNLPEREALRWLTLPNPHGRPNSDVLRPWANGNSLTQRPEAQWIIDTGNDLQLQDFELYEQPFARVNSLVRPEREKNNRAIRRNQWWLHAETAPGMRSVLKPLPRYLATPRVSKYRVFVWLEPEVLCDDGVYTFARSDDYFFGILQSRVHEVWALKTGTQLEDRPRYTPKTCFDTFPFPIPTETQHAAICAAAKTLNERREAFRNPPDWMNNATVSFRASVDGPWERLVQNPDANGMGTVTWTRLALKPELGVGAAFKKERTLTNLYNIRPQWLIRAHSVLDSAVLDAYKLAADASDDEILAHLLELNLSRAKQQTNR